MLDGLRRLWQLFGRSRVTAPNPPPRPPYPANVPGPFYVEDGCCISCGVWEEVAPDLLAWHEEEGNNYAHCFVARQPETDAEFSRMMDAMKVGEVDCIRVRNCRPDWEQRLRDARLGDQIDIGDREHD